MAPRGLDWVLGACLLVHVSLFASILDIYFRSPLEQGLDSEHSGLGAEGGAPARRAVLIVADGLRADTCFRFLGRDVRFHSAAPRGELSSREAHYQADAATWPSARQSFLREVVERRGSWGLSHTRVPTESRPGHVAMIAGFYEDVSAVTRGWQDNPVEFDHVFNQSRQSWLWGSPDITRMFARRHEHVRDWHYSSAEEDFAAKDLTVLDTMVFNRVGAFLQGAKENATLRAELAQDRLVFFLHLLGLDSNGHAHRPSSPEYTLNMALVDRGVAAVAQLFEDYYGDGLTAFVFTSDHGMSAKGAHGDGDPANTRTPLVAWGAGVRGPEPAGESEDPRGGVDTGFSAAQERRLSRDWGLGHLRRLDIEQADLAPLLASLIGVPNPVHSVGRLPSRHLLASSFASHSLLRNARQLLRQAQHKERARRDRMVWFTPFGRLADAAALAARAEALLLQQGQQGQQQQNQQRQQQDFEQLCLDVIQVSLDGMRYYQLYDRPYLSALVVAGYAGWVLLLATELHGGAGEESGRSGGSTPREASPLLSLSLCVLAIGAALVLWQALEGSPVMYHVYVAISAGSWALALRRPSVMRLLRGAPSAQPLLYLAGTQALAVTYTHRWMYAPLFVALGLWPLTEPALAEDGVVVYPSHTGVLKSASARTLRSAWLALCCALGAFSTLPLDFGDSPALLAAGAAALLAALFSADLEGLGTGQRVAQLALVLASAAASLHTDRSLAAKQGLPPFNQVLTWAAFFGAPLLVARGPATPYKRFLALWAGLSVPTCLLSLNYEVLFFACLGATLLLWIVLERAVYYHAARQHARQLPARQRGAQGLHMGDVRAAFIFLLMVHIAFFGTGNIASMSSFQLSATYRFVTTFSPFLMGALCIVVKLVPYLLVTAAMAIVAAERRASRASTLDSKHQVLLLVALYDLVAIRLFFAVRDEGSWLDIGNSISQFGLVNAQCVFLPLLFWSARLFLRGVNIDTDLADTK